MRKKEQTGEGPDGARGPVRDSYIFFFYNSLRNGQLQVKAGQDPRMRADLGEVNLGKRVEKFWYYRGVCI
jgi:hypothetical protein